LSTNSNKLIIDLTGISAAYMVGKWIESELGFGATVGVDDWTGMETAAASAETSRHLAEN
jgi:hypothetical protein